MHPTDLVKFILVVFLAPRRWVVLPFLGSSDVPGQEFDFFFEDPVLDAHLLTGALAFELVQSFSPLVTSLTWSCLISRVCSIMIFFCFFKCFFLRSFPINPRLREFCFTLTCPLLLVTGLLEGGRFAVPGFA